MKLLTASEVADRLSVPESWVYRAAREGTMPSVKLGRYVRFEPDRLNEWIRDGGESSVDGH